jgi:hypothetical protein
MATLPLERTILFTGRIGRATIYRLGPIGILRAVSNLTGERVKKDPKFRRTMANAAILGRASGIGSFVYRELPKEFRQFWMYKAFTGEAIHLLRAGKTDEEAQDILWKTYAEIWVIKAQRPVNVCRRDKTGLVPVMRRAIQVSPVRSVYSLPFQQSPYTLPPKRRRRKKELLEWPP